MPAGMKWPQEGEINGGGSWRWLMILNINEPAPEMRHAVATRASQAKINYH
jgi:hypothetical protein